jgi:membrane protease YdiL (CAAX protease family)
VPGAETPASARDAWKHGLAGSTIRPATMPSLQRLRAAFRVDPLDRSDRLFEFRRILRLPPWLQIVLIAGLFATTVFATHAEYRSRGTVFGFPGPGFNVLVCPIYEELIFRGWILGRMAHAHAPAIAILGSSLLFGLLHLRNIYWLEPAALARLMLFTGLVLGPLLAWSTLRVRSVWPAVILHYLNNLTYYL